MAFDSGSMSFTRFAVIGDAPTLADEATLAKLAEHKLTESDLGLPMDVEYGWCAGRHVLDMEFDAGHMVYADALHFGLRIDTNKAPGDLRRAYRAIEESAAAKGNPSGFASKLQKKDAKDTADRRIDDELRSGRFRRSKMIPMLWDLPAKTLYAPVSMGQREVLYELLDRTFGLKLEPLGPTAVTLRKLEPLGKRRDVEDLSPTRFVIGPDGDTQAPDYPWTAKGEGAKDYLGNEFMLWLWHEALLRGGEIKTEAGVATILFDKMLDLDCAYGVSGRDVLRREGPTQMPEALDALRTGKLPRKAGLIVDGLGQQFTLSLAAETLGVSGLKLPPIEEAENPRALIETRIGLLRDFSRVLDNMFFAFLKARTAGSWESAVQTMRHWITTSQRPRPAAAVAAV